MQAYPKVSSLLLVTGVITLASCSSVESNPVTQQVQATTRSSALNISASDKQKIGKKIWKNESGGSVAGLTQWNDGEEFPSIGIGHFIWYPKNYNGPYEESFPLFIKYALQHGSQGLPSWVTATPDAPWSSKAVFQREFNNPQVVALRSYLANNLTLQTDFIVARSRAALAKILAAAPAAQRSRIQSNYHKVSTTGHGTYALIDYVNFKGDGTSHKERYQGQGWGLMWVLMEMRDVPSGQAAASEFAAAAKRSLDRRIKNAPSSRGEARWRAGWHNRCDTYATPL